MSTLSWDKLGKPGHAVLFKNLISEETHGISDLMLGFAKLPSGASHLPHHHETETEFFYVISGEADFMLDGQTIHLAPGMAILVQPGGVHAISSSCTASTSAAFSGSALSGTIETQRPQPRPKGLREMVTEGRR